MPTESAPPSEPPIPGPSHHPSSLSIIKCSICGAGGFPSASSRDDTDGIVVLNETVERICVGCARAQETARRADRARDELGGIGLGLGLMGRERDEDVERDDGMVADPSYPLSSPQPLEIPLSSTASSPPAARSYSQSLPIRHTRPWATANSAPPVIAESRSPTPTRVAASEGAERLPNPLLDVASARVPSTGRGALYPGSIFKGTQTSGRSAYEVEVRFLVSVPLPLSLSIFTPKH